jgi:L-malate glycosyltransferase
MSVRSLLFSFASRVDWPAAPVPQVPPTALERPASGPKDAYAFVLGWPLSEIGGVNQVIRSLIAQLAHSDNLRPVLIQAFESQQRPASVYDFETIPFPLPAPTHAKRPLLALARYFLRLPRTLLRLRALCRANSIRILNPHFIGLEHLSLGLLRRLRLFSGKLILSFHGSDLRSLMQGSVVQRILARILLRSADHLVACSQGLAEEMLFFVPDLASRMAVIPNGIDASQFRHSSSVQRVLPKNFAGRPYLLNIGAFEYKKGHDILVRAFAEIRKHYPALGLVIAGQSMPLPTPTEALIRDLGLGEHTVLIKDVPRTVIADLLRSCELFVLSSRWEKGRAGEGFALALLEAGAMGKPVVSTRSCGVAELIIDGESGALVPPEDPDALAKAVCMMLADPDEAARRAANLNRIVRERFTWEKAFERYESLMS